MSCSEPDVVTGAYRSVRQGVWSVWDGSAGLSRINTMILVAPGAAVVTALGTGLLVNIFQRKQEARNPFCRVMELNDDTEEPAIWGKNFPLQYDDYVRTFDQVRTRYGGSEAAPHTPTMADPRAVVAQSRIEEDPRLTTMWAGYAFAKNFCEERVHAYMLDDQRSRSDSRSVSREPACTAMPRFGYPIASSGTATCSRASSV